MRDDRAVFTVEDPLITRALGPRARLAVLLGAAAVAVAACQNPTDTDDKVSYDDAIDISATPDPISRFP